MSRIVDRGAITAAYVGIGMAVTIAISFLLVIPIEPIVWLLALPSGLLIGYYANQRSNRRAGPWSRIVRNGLFAAAVTGLSMAALLLMVKAIFFFADTGFPDFNRVDENGAAIPPTCSTGADCVYARYLALGRGAELEEVGVTDAASFGAFYWSSQATSAGAIIVLTLLGGLGGAVAYGATRPRPVPSAAAGSPDAAASGQDRSKDDGRRAIADIVAALQNVGWFADRADPSPTSIAARIDAGYREEFGKPLTPDDPLFEEHIAAADTTRVWWQDLEADVHPGNETYVRTIAELAAISQGAFRPEDVREVWAADGSAVTVSMRVGDQHVEVSPTVADDWIDLKILGSINASIEGTDRRFVMLEPFDQTAFVMALSPSERAGLERLGWWGWAPFADFH